jgi:hypothetical protein
MKGEEQKLGLQERGGPLAPQPSLASWYDVGIEGGCRERRARRGAHQVLRLDVPQHLVDVHRRVLEALDAHDALEHRGHLAVAGLAVDDAGAVDEVDALHERDVLPHLGLAGHGRDGADLHGRELSSAAEVWWRSDLRSHAAWQALTRSTLFASRIATLRAHEQLHKCAQVQTSVQGCRRAPSSCAAC